MGRYAGATATAPNGNGGSERPPSALALYLRDAMRRYGIVRKSHLWKAADISDTYLESLLTGYYRDNGNPVHPTPEVLRQIARALTKGDPLEEEEEYLGMMMAVGYLPNFSGLRLPGEMTAAQRARERAFLLRERERAALIAQLEESLEALRTLTQTNLSSLTAQEEPPAPSDK